MSENKPFVSVIICTQNRKEYLKKYALPSVFGLAYPNYEVIIVDDSSNDGTELFLQNYTDPRKRLKIIRNKRSNGIACARNIGSYYAQGEIVAFTDDDCFVAMNWLDELIGKFMENKNLMAAGGFVADRDSDKPAFAENQIYGCNMAFRKEVFNKFLFDSNLFFHKAPFHEETDFVNRLERHGYLTVYVPKALVMHFAGPASYRGINRRIGNHLNSVYMDAKKFSLARYYYKIFKRSNEMFRKIKQLYNEKILSFPQALFEIGWVNCILFFEIPWKAKKAHFREEKIFNLEAGENKLNDLFLKSVKLP